MSVGAQCIVLHAHLPYIRHPEHQRFLEEAWLFEAINETYIPLLQMLKRLQRTGLRQVLALSLSPPLMSMLRDDFLQQRYLAYMEKMRQLASQEIRRTRGDAQFGPLARLYAERLEQALETYEGCERDLVGAFAELHRAGVLELFTSAATHGFLPLLKTEPAAVRAQLEIGARTFQSMTDLAPRGVWLPECGYYRGLEAAVEEAGFGYFFLDTHGVLNAAPRPYYGVTAPIVSANGVAAFGRDPDSSRQVWSRDEGYPGDFAYRDFYRDIGFDLDFETIRPFILDGQTRTQTGFKYYRITGPGDEKAPYDPQQAAAQVQIHAADFVTRCRRSLESQGGRQDPLPLSVSPYDAELFGHWWFEGPQWLEAVITRMAADDALELTTPTAYLDAHQTLQCATPSPSSWGEGGYNGFWLNPGNDWVYPYLHAAARRMTELARRHRNAEPGGLHYRALQQAARALLLAQASDWAFIMRAGTSENYALSRTRDHLARFNYLAESLDAGAIDERRLQALEVMDRLFPDLAPEIFA